MVLVPPEAAVRMRMQTEADLLPPVHPVREIPSDLPELRPGQTFTARIQEALPDNTYRALVAGKQLTLQLPEGAKPGDLLELVVVDRSGKVIIARQVEANGPAAGAAGPYAYAKFSPAARLIGQLLPAEGEAAPPALLNRGQPLLAAPPQAQNATALLAPALGKAVVQSGVFYEAHQAQWINGKLPLAQLLQEPQGQRSAAAVFQQAASEKVGAGRTARETGTTAPLVAQTSARNPQPVPDEMRPLVQQQLEAAASNRVFWHGEVWPRQAIEWAIEWDGERAAGDGGDAQAHWRTVLSLVTPRLGKIDANLQLSAKGVSIALATPAASSAAALRAASAGLAQALAAAGVPLLGFKVESAHEHPAGQE